MPRRQASRRRGSLPIIALSLAALSTLSGCEVLEKLYTTPAWRASQRKPREQVETFRVRSNSEQDEARRKEIEGLIDQAARSKSGPSTDTGARALATKANLPAEEDFALRVNDTLLYPVQFGRAEDLVDTLAPLLQARYGAGAQVIAHPQSNHLLIRVPPPNERSLGGAGRGIGASSRATGARGTGGTTSSGRSRANR